MISILCPTRKRLDSLRRMWASAVDTADKPSDIEFVFCIDDDDIESENTISDLKGLHENICLIYSGDNIYSNLHNLCAENSQGEIIFGAADDLIFRTQGWDSIVNDSMKEHKGVASCFYPDDGYWGEKFGTHCFFTREWLDILGYLSPPIFTVDYSDNYIQDVAKGIDRYFYIPNVLVEHMHWTFGKSEFDTTSQEAHIRRGKDNNKKVYEGSKHLIETDILKIKNGN